MKFVKTIILSIVLAFAATKRTRREEKKCHSSAACKNTEYCGDITKKHGQDSGHCKAKHDKNTFCLRDEMCKSGKCDVAKQVCQ